MKFFSDCSGDCCVCGCGGGCLAGHGDDDYDYATTEQVLERLSSGKYPNYTKTMVDYLKERNVSADVIEKALKERENNV